MLQHVFVDCPFAHGVQAHPGQVLQSQIPIVVDLGKRSRKKIRALKEGRGELMAEVGEALQRVRAADVLEGRDLLPVVLIYRQKSRRGRGGRGGFGLTSLMPPPFNLLR